MDYLTAAQLSEWEAYDRIDPIGTWREDYRMALLAATFTNLTIAVNGKSGTPMKVPIDFMPDWANERSTEPKRQSVEEMKAFLTSFAKEHNKRINEQKKFPRLPPNKGI